MVHVDYYSPIIAEPAKFPCARTFYDHSFISIEVVHNNSQNLRLYWHFQSCTSGGL